MQKKKRTALEATVDVVGRDQQDQILYLSKDPNTQIWNLDKTETELHREPPDPVLEAVAKLVTPEQPEWTGSPSELAEKLNIGMAANALTKYLNVKCGRLADEYGIRYENKATCTADLYNKLNRSATFATVKTIPLKSPLQSSLSLRK